MEDLNGIRVHITGIVQGVGFRPFVYNLATRLQLTGWVRNTSAGVDIEVDGTPSALDHFTHSLESEAPPLARIDSLSVEPRPANGFASFEILKSEATPESFQPISPDVSICPDCLRELFDPLNRRFQYPFTNCTNCGPRFTIIKDIPYDRPKTTMAGFDMCPDCEAEYRNPLDRRFHAQPVACSTCGPHVWLESLDGERISSDQDDGPIIQEAANYLAAGQVVAVKGLGGYHLACDATNLKAVLKLRERKLRVDKPFAVMMPDLETVETHCFLGAVERQLLESRERPIVILKRRSESTVVAEVSPGQETLGVMLPYTPLHYLLFSGERQGSCNNPDLRLPRVLVMTSGNLSEEPIAIENEEARQRLGSLADVFLMHDRPIHIRCDDSVVRTFTLDKEPPHLVPLRRSRGYAPFPVRLPKDLPPIFASGAELKNTFCLTQARYAFLSHHIGDLENYETLRSFEEGVVHFERLFRVNPEAIAYDLHPDYLATRYALARAQKESLPAFGVQHHHAHICACMAEHGLSGDHPVIGVSFDGTGYGEDGAIWGGEFLLANYAGYQRLAHLKYVPLPGGDKAIREPWRQALAWLAASGQEWEEDLPPVSEALHGNVSRGQSRPSGAEVLRVLEHQLQTGINAPLTSSMGRLFDAAAALAGVRQVVNYEAQAAIEFESLADQDEGGVYSFEVLSPGAGVSTSESWVISPAPVFQGIVEDLRRNVPVGRISARFHNGIAQMVLDVLVAMRNSLGVSTIALSGGVWQNLLLLQKTLTLLSQNNFHVLIHNLVPTNDAGISLGQAISTAYRLEGGTGPQR
jgi:hydrogenase maturation protein HypF